MTNDKSFRLKLQTKMPFLTSSAYPFQNENEKTYDDDEDDGDDDDDDDLRLYYCSEYGKIIKEMDVNVSISGNVLYFGFSCFSMHLFGHYFCLAFYLSSFIMKSFLPFDSYHGWLNQHFIVLGKWLSIRRQTRIENELF